MFIVLVVCDRFNVNLFVWKNNKNKSFHFRIHAHLWAWDLVSCPIQKDP